MDRFAQDVRQFLAGHAPFNLLSRESLDALSEQVKVSDVPQGATLLDIGGKNDTLYVIRLGAVDILDKNEQLQARFGEGEFFGHRSLFRQGRVESIVRSIEPSTLYSIKGDVFRRLCEECDPFRYYFGPYGAQRLRHRRSSQGVEEGELSLIAATAREVMTTDFATAPPGISVNEAAQRMNANQSSALLVIGDHSELLGIVTDSDMRRRVIAEGRPLSVSVADIMTDKPVSVAADGDAFRALLEMARRGIHHLPVVEAGQAVGLIGATELLRRRAVNSVYLLADIEQQTTLDGLVETSKRLPEMLAKLMESNAPSHGVAHIISSIGEAINVRLLAMAEATLGSPPVPYAWMVGGSLARLEQTGRSDQDNFMVIDDSYDPGRHGDYFKALAKFVSDGLDACGYVYCPGKIMATTNEYRQPLAKWKTRFDRWIGQPDPKALLNATVFFDLRCIHGDRELAGVLADHLRLRAAKDRIFLAHLARNALTFHPPLGFFRNFVLIRGGEHDSALDLKLSGIVPIIELGRIHGLASGATQVNTRDRLLHAGATGELSKDGSEHLLEAYDTISELRLKHQARQIRTGEKADNFVNPDDLTAAERADLKDAFVQVRRMQGALSQSYQLEHFG